MFIKKLFCLFLFLFFIQSAFSMSFDQDFSQKTMSDFDQDFFRSVSNVYINICRIEPANLTPEFLELVQKLMQEIFFFRQEFDNKQKQYKGNNLDMLLYFFALSKKFYQKDNLLKIEKIEFHSFPEIFIVNFIILWGLTEKFLQDNFDALKTYFNKVLYYVYYFDKNLFWILFDKYCWVNFKDFTSYIYPNDVHCVLFRGYKEKMILKDFFLEYCLCFKYFNVFSVELFLKDKIFNSYEKRDLFFKKRNFSLFYFLNSFVNFKKKENPSDLYEFQNKKVIDVESIFDAQQRRVLNTINFELFLSDQEIEEIKGLFYA